MNIRKVLYKKKQGNIKLHFKNMHVSSVDSIWSDGLKPLKCECLFEKDDLGSI